MSSAPSSGGGPLPVGVVIPCRNAAAYLPAHLSALEGWLDLAEEVVVVDSESTDGTLDLLRRGLRHPRLRFFAHPPGLYASWNFGLAQLKAEYAYIATVGDRTTRDGLRHLHEVATRLGSDLVISPPTFVGTSGEALADRPWPVFRLLEWLRMDRPCAIRSEQAFLVTVLMCPSGALGSSASNLYRTSFLRRCPFPADVGHAGDTAWTLLHGLGARWALTPRRVAEFLLHPGGASTADPDQTLAQRLHDLALTTCSREGSWLTAVVAAWRDDVAALRYAERHLRRLRQRGGLWRVHPAQWFARRRRNRLRAHVARSEEQLVEAHFRSVPPGHCLS